MRSDLARTWSRLRDVRSAWETRADLPVDAGRDLLSILDKLPPQWKEVVCLPHLPAAQWQMHSPVRPLGPGNLRWPLLQGPDPLSGETCLWELWPGGRLHPFHDQAFGALPAPHYPALVHLRPKPVEAWLRADYVAHAAQQHLPLDQRTGILEPWLVGAWRDLQLDPRVWGIKVRDEEHNLLDLQVRHARLTLHHLHLSTLANADRIRGYAEERAAYPRIWPTSDDVADSGHGLRVLEAKWAAALRPVNRPPDDSPDPADLPQHRWLDLQRLLPPRPAPGERAPPHLDRAPAVLLRHGFAKAWARLADMSLHRPFRVTCYQILHGTLGCGAFLRSIPLRGNLRDDLPPPLCPLQECTAAGCLDSLSHGLLHCPASAPVIGWLLNTWERLARIRLPPSPALLLGDYLADWPPPSPGAPLLRLWTVLRVTTLGVIWKERVARAHGVHDDGRHAIQLIQDMVRAAIRRDWLRTQVDLRTLDDGAFCLDWWRGRDCSLSVEAFVALWATPPVLCHVLGERPAAGAADTRSLELLL